MLEIHFHRFISLIAYSISRQNPVAISRHDMTQRNMAVSRHDLPKLFYLILFQVNFYLKIMQCLNEQTGLIYRYTYITSTHTCCQLVYFPVP